MICQLKVLLSIYRAGNEFIVSKLFTILFSHSWPYGGLKSLLATQAWYLSPICILPMSVFLSNVNVLFIVLLSLLSSSVQLEHLL